MSTSYLLNNVQLGTTFVYAGSLFDDASAEKTQLVAEGGTFAASTTSGLAAAAARCETMTLRGVDPMYREILMNNALAFASQATALAAQAAVLAQDTVSTVSQTRLVSSSVALQAAGVTVHATDAGGAVLALVAGFTNPLPRRTINIARSDAGPANVTYSLSMKLPDGTTAIVPLIVAKNSNASSTVAGELLGVSTTVDPVSTSAIKTGTGYSLGAAFTGTPILGVNGVVEAIVTSDATSGTIVPTSAPNGAKEFAVFATFAHTHTLS